MQETHEQLTQIRLLSDRDLYAEAQEFLKSYKPPENKQMNGLLEFSHDIGELQSFVKHQKDRDWGTGSKQHYKTFYSELGDYLQKLRQRVKTPYGLVAGGLTAKVEKAQVDFFSGWLAREFVQHLVAQAQMMRDRR